MKTIECEIKSSQLIQLGTTDFSVCEISDGLVEVKASKGDVFLGGSDWDNALAKFLMDSFKEETSIDLSKDAQAHARILEAAEKAKIELSNSPSTEVNLPYITVKDNQPQHLIKTITKAKFEQLTQDLVDKVVACGKRALEAAEVKASDLNCILMVGGQSRSTAIQDALTKEFGAELNKSVNPDECVALGAAVQANIIEGGEGAKDILLLDVTPISLGIETMGGVFTKLIDANTTIPCKKEETFSTAVDNQTMVTVKVLQGERPMAKDNKEIGIFNLDGIMPAPRGIPQIVVSFELDASSILTVTAKDKATNKEQHITIETKGNLSQDEIDRIKREAEEHAAEDAKAKALADKLNQAEAMVFGLEKALKENNEKLSEEEKTLLAEKIQEVRNAIAERDEKKVSDAQEELQKAWEPIITKLYAQQADTTNETTTTEEDTTVEDAQVEE